MQKFVPRKRRISTACFAGENADEGSFESAVKGGVDNRVDDRRRVTEP